ncbi:MAG TPA: DUF167 domain-containing protein [Anaerolineales bacterium]|nr:DUF167 domain-containing protein [Anaerolineales bacterium]
MEIRPGGQGAALLVKITPRAKRTAVIGRLDDGSLKIAVAAPPEDGKANAALIRFLALTLGVREAHIEIVSGHGAPRKLIAITGLTPAEVERRLVPTQG